MITFSSVVLVKVGNTISHFISHRSFHFPRGRMARREERRIVKFLIRVQLHKGFF
jgi:hypothetical protein